MKVLLLTIGALVNFYMPSAKTNCDIKFSVKIWNYNYSMAYTTFYTLSNDGIEVKYIDGVKGGKDSVLLKRSLNKNECKIVADFFSSHNISGLKSNYSNNLVDDGDQKKVLIEVDGKIKKIRLSNAYQKDLGELFDAVNKIVDKKIRIRYKAHY